MKLVLITMIMSMIIFGMLVLPSSFGQQSSSPNHPLTPVTESKNVGNGTVFQLKIVFNEKPVQDIGLAEYNKAVNFGKAKSQILNATFSDKMLKDIISDVEKQRAVLLTEGNNIKRYYTNGSTTLEYSDWWMQSYVISRLDEDGLQVISSNQNAGMNMQNSIDPIDKEMQRIISNYNLNYTQSAPESVPPNPVNSTTMDYNKTQSIPTSYPTILNMTKNVTSVNEINDNRSVVANTSKATSSIPEFGSIVGVIVIVAVIGSLVMSRRFSNVW